VTVKEAKTGEFSFGGGYSSIDFLIGFVSVTQRNFDIVNFPTFVGGGQNLTLKAEFGMVRQNYLISWTDPWFLGCPFSFGFDLYRTSHDKKLQVGYGYEETRTGGDLRVGKEFTDNLKTDCIYRLEEIKIASVNENASSDLANEQGSKWISSVAFAPSYDTRDNVFNPTRGWFATCGAEYAGGVIGGNKDFVKFTGSASYYRSFFEKIVLELKAYTGIASAYGKTKQVPIYERFFSGGANSIRGYGERMVSPRDPGSNDPVGGEGVFVGNAEVTFPIFERLLKGAVFYDMGNTWRYKRDYGTGHLRSGTGVGVRVKTPIGPLKLDYGWPLSANYDDKREGQFYFSVSHGF
jgi:outer membrane protein insertion porin family